MMSLEDIVDSIALDHCYTKAWSAYPNAANVKPACKLFMSRATPDRPTLSLVPAEDLDVLTPDSAAPLGYDGVRARSLMNECLRNVNFARRPANEGPEEWEERISRVGWSLQQSRLFNRVTKALQSNRLARLAYEGHSNEPVMQRLYIDKAAKRVRQALAAVSWETSLIQWLHGLLMANVNQDTLAMYLDVLQTLRAKVPSLVDKMLEPTYAEVDSTSAEALQLLLTRPWDPLTSHCALSKQKKWPISPTLLVVPSGPSDANPDAAKRRKLWNVQMGAFGKVVPLAAPQPSKEAERTVGGYKWLLYGTVLRKIAELKQQGCKQLVLVGWDVGALITCQVSAVEPVDAVVCLGLPLLSARGVRGSVDDPLLDSTAPTLIVVGQLACRSAVDDVEELRERGTAGRETSLVVVGGADDALRMTHARRKAEGVTQSMVDRIVQDKIAEFLVDVFVPTLTTVDGQPVEALNKATQKKKRGASPSGDPHGSSGASMSSVTGPLLSQAWDAQKYAAYHQALHAEKKRKIDARKSSKVSSAAAKHWQLVNFNSGAVPASSPQAGLSQYGAAFINRLPTSVADSSGGGLLFRQRPAFASAQYAHIASALTGSAVAAPGLGHIRAGGMGGVVMSAGGVAGSETRANWGLYNAGESDGSRP